MLTNSYFEGPLQALERKPVKEGDLRTHISENLLIYRLSLTIRSFKLGQSYLQWYKVYVYYRQTHSYNISLFVF